MNSGARSRRSGVTLLELVMVITVMGIVAAIGASRFGRTAFANFGSQGEARTLSLSMLRAQRAAITTGDNHYIQFDAMSPDAATQYSVMRRASGGDTLVEGPYALSDDVEVIASATAMDFNFEGEAASNYRVDFIGTGRNWRVDVVPITGAVVVTEIAP